VNKEDEEKKNSSNQTNSIISPSNHQLNPSPCTHNHKSTEKLQK
jgi:hypothetical protein